MDFTNLAISNLVTLRPGQESAETFSFRVDKAWRQRCSQRFRNILDMIAKKVPMVPIIPQQSPQQSSWEFPARKVGVPQGPKVGLCWFGLAQFLIVDDDMGYPHVRKCPPKKMQQGQKSTALMKRVIHGDTLQASGRTCKPLRLVRMLQGEAKVLRERRVYLKYLEKFAFLCVMSSPFFCGSPLATFDCRRVAGIDVNITIYHHGRRCQNGSMIL